MKDGKLILGLILTGAGIVLLIGSDYSRSFKVTSIASSQASLSLDDSGADLEVYYPQDTKFKELFKKSSLYSSTVSNGVYLTADGTQISFTPNSDEENYADDLAEAITSKEADLYVVKEGDLPAFLNSKYSLSLIDQLGFSSSDFSYQYDFVREKGLDLSDVLRASSFEVSSGLFAYRRDIAQAVLGSQEPSEVQEKIKDQDSLNQTAALLKSAGYYLSSSLDDNLEAYYSNSSAALIDSASYFHMPSSLQNWIEQSKNQADNGYSHKTEKGEMYWEMDHQYGSKVFGFYLSSEEMGDLIEESGDEVTGLYGKWGLCQGNMSYRRDNYYLLASPYCDKMTEAKKIISALTCDQSEMRRLAVNANILVNSAYAQSNAEISGSAYVSSDSQTSGTYAACFEQDALHLFAEAAKEDVLGSKRTIKDKTILGYISNDFSSYFSGTSTYDACLKALETDLKNGGLKIPAVSSQSE